MLAIRMQRLGRKGHPTYRVVVQDSRQTPTSGKYVALLGSYDPHTKTTTLVKEKAEFYLKHGAQPSDRVARLFTSEGVTLPTWVKQPTERTRDLRNPEKLRKNRPAEDTPAEETPEASDAPVEEVAEAPATEEVAAAEEVTPEAEAEAEAEADTTEETPSEEVAEEAPKEEPAAEAKAEEAEASDEKTA